MPPKSYQGPRAKDQRPEHDQNSMSQDARLAFEKAYSQTRVADLLEEKPSEIYAITASMTLAAAIAELSTRRIGNMPVIEPGTGMVGVLSERDIVRATAEHGEEVMSHAVRDYMTRNPVTCSAEDRIADVMQRMTEGRFRHLPVVDDGRLIGVISIRDVVLHRVQETEYEALRLKQLMVG